MDIFISYGRIQMLYPKLTFMAKTSVYKISTFLFVLCCFVNIPTIISRQNIKVEFKINSNTTTVLYAFGKPKNCLENYLKDSYFLIFYKCTNKRSFKLYHKQNFRNVSVYMHHPAWRITCDSRDISKHCCYSLTETVHRSQE